MGTIRVEPIITVDWMIAELRLIVFPVSVVILAEGTDRLEPIVIVDSDVMDEVAIMEPAVKVFPTDTDVLTDKAAALIEPLMVAVEPYRVDTPRVPEILAFDVRVDVNWPTAPLIYVADRAELDMRLEVMLEHTIVELIRALFA